MKKLTDAEVRTLAEEQARKMVAETFREMIEAGEIEEAPETAGKDVPEQKRLYRMTAAARNRSPKLN